MLEYLESMDLHYHLHFEDASFQKTARISRLKFVTTYLR